MLINVLELTVLGEQILPRSAVDSLLNHASTVSGLGGPAQDLMGWTPPTALMCHSGGVDAPLEGGVHGRG